MPVPNKSERTNSFPKLFNLSKQIVNLMSNLRRTAYRYETATNSKTANQAYNPNKTDTP